MGKRLVSIMLTVLLIMIFSVSAFAVEMTTYGLNGLGLSIQVPSYCDVYHRSMQADDPLLAEIGLTLEEKLYDMHANDEYLLATSYEDDAVDVEIWAEPTEYSDFDSFRYFDYPDALTSLYNYFEVMYDPEMKVITNHEAYETDRLKFLKIEADWDFSSIFSSDDGDWKIYLMDFYTVYNGSLITISLSSYFEEFSPESIALAESIIGSIDFDAAMEEDIDIPSALPGSTFRYTDYELGVSFSIPENWVEYDMPDYESGVDAEFYPESDPEYYILYSGYDMWASWDESAKAGLERADINSYNLTSADIAIKYGLSAQDLSTDEFGGVKYFVWEDYDEAYYQVTNMLYIDNGYAYHFLYGGVMYDSYYSDFTMLLDSAVYPEGSKPADDWSFDVGDVGMQMVRNEEGNVLVGEIIFAVIVCAIICIFPMVVFRFARKTEPIKKGTAMKIAIIYGAIALVVIVGLMILSKSYITAAVAGGVILICSFLNYLILASGKVKDNWDTVGKSPVAPEIQNRTPENTYYGAPAAQDNSTANIPYASPAPADTSAAQDNTAVNTPYTPPAPVNTVSNDDPEYDEELYDSEIEDDSEADFEEPDYQDEDMEAEDDADDDAYQGSLSSGYKYAKTSGSAASSRIEESRAPMYPENVPAYEDAAPQDENGGVAEYGNSLPEQRYRYSSVPSSAEQSAPVSATPVATPSADPTATPAQPAKFCRNCGQKLDADSNFCTSCGEKVIK